MTAERGGAGPADSAAVSRARGLVVAILCLLVIAQAAYGVANGGPGEGPSVVALMVLPVLYVIPATRRWWERHRFWLLAAQIVLTFVPFALFGTHFIAGPPGWLGGLVLLTLPGPASWLLLTVLALTEELVRASLVGLPYAPAWSAALWVLIAFAIDALVVFGLVRLADFVAEVYAARGELADAAMIAERLNTADNLRSAIGARLTAAAGETAAALPAMARSHAQARKHIAEAGAAARQAIADVRTVTARYRGPAGPEVIQGAGAGTVLAPRLARAALVLVICAFAVQNVNDVFLSLSMNHAAAAPVSPHLLGWVLAATIAIVALQLRHSWPSQQGSRPGAWPVTLAVQALLTYIMVPVLGWPALVMCGLLAGSVLLLVPGRRARAAFTAVVASVPALWPAEPIRGLTPLAEISAAVFLTAIAATFGLVVYGLSRLARLALQLESLRGELARMAVLKERLRVARDTHDLLGLGLSAIALKADLITRLIGRDDPRACTEIGEMARICATARDDIQLVTGETGHQRLEAELDAARALLVSAGIDVRADFAATPALAAGAPVLVPVVREAVTNILRHSSARQCIIETVHEPGVLRLRISNDGVTGPSPGVGRAGHGLGNLTVRVEAAGGRLTSRHSGSRFDLVAELPLPAP